MVRALITVFAVFCWVNATCQSSKAQKLSVGVELDALPYLTGGYFAAGWIGKNHVRGRMLTAKVNKPDVFIKEGFTNNKVTAYAMLCDYFLKETWKGWWAGTGLVFWKSSIQSEAKASTAQFDNLFLNGSAGYHFKMGNRFYAGPWVGMHLRIAGDKNVPVDNKTYSPPLLNPEASVKLGVIF